MNGKLKTILSVAIAATFCVLWICLLLIPTGSRAGAKEEAYACTWADGSVSRERYEQAYRAFAGISPAGEILLERDGMQGVIRTSDKFRSVRDMLNEGGLNTLLGVSASGVNRPERAALWRTYCDRLWYSEGLFRYTGERVEQVKTAIGKELVLLSGSVTSNVLLSLGVTRLEIRAEAEFTAKSLIGTGIEEFSAYPPYGGSDGAIYLDTAGGKRLIAGIPKAKTVRVQGNGFADRGALLPCAEIEELTLPFIGNAEYEENGMLAWLFSDGTEYRVPASLKKVTVTGGGVAEQTFYRCGTLEEIDLCGMDGARISSKAFAGCTSLNKLHTPCTVELGSGYAVRPLGCGCLLYEKVSGGKN